MGKIIKEISWRSVHPDYIRFAILSYRAAIESDKNIKEDTVFLNRNVIDTIRYSYDCIEASIEFFYHSGDTKQLHIDIPNNWLTREIKRKWNKLSLSDKIGMLIFSWTGESFWKTEEQFILFQDLKKVRDALTHPIPIGTEVEKEILVEKIFKNGSKYFEAGRLSEEETIESKMKLNSSKSIANFSENPTMLNVVDASKSLEIMILHLARLKNLLDKRAASWFAFNEIESNEIVPIENILNSLDRKFEKIWQ